MKFPASLPVATVLVLLGALVLPACAGKSAGGRPTPPRFHPVTGAKLFALAPALEVSPDAGELYLQCKVSLDSGILEFLLVQGSRKAYESALTTETSPSQLMAGMILLKWKPGDLLAITLLQNKDTLPLPSLLHSRGKPTADAGLRWRLTGSNHEEVEKGGKGFWADQEGIHIALVERAESVIQLDGNLKNPYHNAGFGYELHPGQAHRKGSPITLIIRKAKPKAP